MRDILKRLRSWQSIAANNHAGVAPVDYVVLRDAADEIERLTRELAVVNAQSEWRLKNAENTRRWADFVVERLREALAACRKYADARLTDDPNDGLALVIEKVVSGRMGPLRDQAEGGE